MSIFLGGEKKAFDTASFSKGLYPLLSISVIFSTQVLLQSKLNNPDFSAKSNSGPLFMLFTVSITQSDFGFHFRVGR
jgi:hypothetical protein